MLKEQTDNISTLQQGITKAAKIITSTMGGHGKNVLMFNNGEMTFTKDGVSVANNLAMKDPEEQIGCQLLVNAARQTVKQCGDGTTLTSLLVSEFLNNMMEELKVQPDFNKFVSEANDLIDDIKQKLIESSTKIESANDIYNIALTSCKDAKLAELIKNIFVKAGLDANITVDISEYFTSTYVEYTTGLNFDAGFVNAGFGNQENGNCTFEKPLICVFNDAVNHYNELDEVVRNAHSEGIPVVFIAPNFSELVVRYALTNKESGVKICLIKTPGWADGIKHNIKDINVFLNDDGTVNKINVTPYEFTLFNNPNKTKIKKRVKQLQAMLENSTEDWEKKEFEKRIGNIQQKSVIIYVGGVTEKNAKEEFDRTEDAIGAVKSATTLGYQKGVGVKLYELADNYPNWLGKVLKAPNKKIMDNAKFNTYGEQINTRTFEIDSNLIDPTSVLISAIENAYNLVKLLITTEYVIYS